jgi:hypothetical protein
MNGNGRKIMIIRYLANPKSAIFRTALLSLVERRRFCHKNWGITYKIYFKGQD